MMTQEVRRGHSTCFSERGLNYLLVSRHDLYRYEKTDLLRFEVYILIVLKDSRMSKAMNRATTVCAAKCFIANINEFYGRIL